MKENAQGQRKWNKETPRTQCKVNKAVQLSRNLCQEDQKGISLQRATVKRGKKAALKNAERNCLQKANVNFKFIKFYAI